MGLFEVDRFLSFRVSRSEASNEQVLKTRWGMSSQTDKNFGSYKPLRRVDRNWCAQK